MKSLVLYFSRADENYFSGTYKYTEKGNTEIVAEKLAAITNADIFKCDPVKAYSKEYDKCIEEAKKDLEENARPEIKPFDKNMADYDTVFVCYPIYFGTMPMHMFTLLEGLDFTGKTVKPLCTHEGGGFGGSQRAVKKACKGATMAEGLAIVGGKANECDKLLRDWI